MTIRMIFIAAIVCFISFTANAQVDLISMTEVNDMSYTKPVEVKSFYVVDEEAVALNYHMVGEKMTYPREAQNLGIEGNVYVRLLVDENGEVIKYHILGPHESIEKEVEKYIKDIEFQAAQLDRYPVTSWSNLIFKFELTD